MNNTPQILKLEHVQTKLVPCYGGQRIESQYTLTTTQNNILNVYTVDAEVRGLNTADPYMNVLSVENLTNNEETLTQEGIEDLLSW